MTMESEVLFSEVTSLDKLMSRLVNIDGYYAIGYNRSMDDDYKFKRILCLPNIKKTRLYAHLTYAALFNKHGEYRDLVEGNVHTHGGVLPILWHSHDFAQELQP